MNKIQNTVKNSLHTRRIIFIILRLSHLPPKLDTVGDKAVPCKVRGDVPQIPVKPMIKLMENKLARYVKK